MNMKLSFYTALILEQSALSEGQEVSAGIYTQACWERISRC